MDIRPVALDDEGDLQAWADVTNAVRRHDSPWVRPDTPASVRGWLTYGWDLEPVVAFLGEEDGAAVACGWYAVSDRDNLHLAWSDVVVHPDVRRRGHGSRLLAHLEAEIRAAGRTSNGGSTWDGNPGAAFLRSHGYEQKTVAINRRQRLGDLDPGLVDRLHAEAVEAASDYELVRTVDRSDAADLDRLAELTAAINDAPRDDLDMEDEVFDAERISAYETAQVESGHRLMRVVARHRDTGELAGQTVVVIEHDRPTFADQHDTSVVRAHRGHRLGALLKTDMLRWLREDQPQVTEVDTWNAESNRFMIGVNEQLGYQVMGRELSFQRSL